MKTIDTRDLLKRKEELEELRDAVTEAQETLTEAKAALANTDAEDSAWSAMDEAQEAVTDAETALESAQADFGPDEQTELEELETLESEISDFRDGETMIPESDFEDYARELAEDTITDFRKQSNSWPFNCLDWERAAKELAYDYTTVSYQGEDYYVRA